MRRAAAALVFALCAAGAGAAALRDIPYGADARQRFDVHLPDTPVQGAPVIFMVHGGGWRIGDKAERAVVAHKAPYFTQRGYIFISTNYRMLPDADPLQQARDVAQALAVAQEKAASWGGDRQRFVLMGHSAGAHLVSLLAADPSLAPGGSWRGTVSLDSGALDVVQIMQRRHLPLYDAAFGRDPAYWRRVSPLHALQPGARPMLLVCSSQRSDACPPNHAFAARLRAGGARAEVLEQAASHRDINLELGRDTAYTRQVQAFIDSLLAP